MIVKAGMGKRVLAIVATTLIFALAGGAAWAFWMATSTAGSNGASAATSVNAGATPTTSVAGSAVTVTWAASTLATGQGVTGYQVKRYDATTLVLQTILSACSGTVAATSCVESSVPPGSWKYSVTPRFATNWMGTESGLSTSVVIETTPPTNSVTLSGITGTAGKTGNTVYYRGSVAGSFTLTNAVADAGSGPASSQTAALTGTTTGWTHTPSTVSGPAGGPYVSNAFAWNAGTTSSPGEIVTGRDVAGNTATTSLTFVDDSTAPSAGTISYLDGYQAGLSVAVTFASGTDGGSGIVTRQLQRASASLTAGACGTFGGFANVGTNNPTSIYTDTQVTNARCYTYRYVVTDLAGNQHIATSASVSKVDYAGAVSATTGALSYWRLGEGTATLTSSDSFAGTSGAALPSRTGEIGATWVHLAGGANAVLSDAGRARRGAVTGYTIDYVTATPSTADYSVEADLNVRSNLVSANDMIGVAGRINTGTNTFYMARWEQADTSWNLIKYANGTVTYLNYVSAEPALVVGETYRIRLEMVGSALKVYVNGVLKAQATDATITAAGRAGIMDGTDASSAAKSNTTGVHLDNFQVTPSTYPRAVDSKGSNTGDYKNGAGLGVAGALPADPDTAAQFDGVNDHVQMTGTTGIPVGASIRSTELWFKTSSAARQVLFAYGSGANTQQYGLWIDAGGTTMTAWGFGGGNDKVFTMPAAVNNGVWHQVVVTYNGTSLTVYIDGVALASQAATRATVMGSYGFSVGAILNSNDGNYGGWFAGSIDEVSFYTTTLTQTNVTNHFELGSSAGADATGPSGGSVDAAGLTGTGARYSTSTALSIAFAPGTDTSGIAPTGATLTRATATLTSAGGTANGVCGTFGGYSLISGGTDPSSPKADTVTDQACYRYQYTVADTLGNPTTYTSGDIKVDTTAPLAPPLAYSAGTNASGSGSTVYYRSAQASGSIVVTGSSTDAASGIATYSYPALGTNWTATPGALGVTTYSWSGAPAAPGTVNVGATSNAGTASPTSPITFVVDNTAPTAGTVSYVNGSTLGTTVSVSFTTGTDSGSGIGTRLLQRSTATLTGITCGSYGSFATISGGTNPVSPVVDTVPADSCIMYQYVVADAVGGTHTASSASVAHTPYGAYWAFDAGSGTTAVDSSGNVNTGTIQAGGGWTTGKVGFAALVVTGATNSFMSAANPVIDTSESYTVAGWIKLNSLTGVHTLASIDGTNINPFYLQLNGGIFVFSQRNSDSTASSYVAVNGLAPTVGTWYHLAGVYNKTANTIQLYVNGVSQGSTTATTAWKATGVTVVGRGKWNAVSTDFVNGTIDEVRFVDRAMTAAEVADLAGTYAEMVAGTSGLLSEWRLGESSSAFAVDDITVTNNNGTYVNSPTAGVAGAIAGDANTAVQFDGVNDYATAARQISGNFSIEFWFKSTQNYASDPFGQPACSQWWQGAGMVDADTGGAANDFGVSLCSGKVVAGTGSPEVSVTSSGTYNDGGWHHVVFTRTQSSGVMTLYVDGASVGTATGVTALLTSTPTINLGRRADGGNYFAGTLDEVAVYTTVLPAATVAAHYNSGL